MDEKNLEVAVPVKGMSCKSCADKIASRVGLLEGVHGIKVDLTNDKVYVRFDPDTVTLDSIKSEIESLGYSVNGAHVKKSLFQGLAYGLVPHIGCIAFIIASVAGATALMQYFKPLLMSPYFFHALIGISFAFATASSAIYLRKNGMLSMAGIRKKRLYLSTMYGSTIGVNLALFLVIFPLLANVSSAAPITTAGTLSSMKISVAIPCSGHASLITSELKTLNGVEGVQFTLPNVFEVQYDQTKVTKEAMLALDVFKTYKATLLSENTFATASVAAIPSGSCCGGNASCGGSCSGSCGGSCGCGQKAVNGSNTGSTA